MSKKGNKLPLLIGVAAIGAYRFYKGKGIFNKFRFKEQHDAVSNYLETHYPHSFYSDITPTEDGWSCVVSLKDRQVVLYMTKTTDDRFIFWENEI